ncbi:hypothetical protein A8B78_20640 [Jannaschia sp. EhC01]|nr:hypothetical protein A8B78_20640 [Jannaschia sp. EhC01]
MATLSTNTARTSQITARPLLALARRLIEALTPAPKTAQDYLDAAHRREAARARVDHLLR